MESYDYFYECSVNPNSKSEIKVYNNNNEESYVLQRFNKTFIDFMFSYREPKSSVNILLNDTNKKKLIEIKEAWSFKRKFYIEYINDSYKLSVAANAKEFNYNEKGINYKIIKKDATKKLLINEKVAVEFLSVRNGFTFKNYLVIYDNAIDIKLAIASLHTFFIAY